MPYLLNFIYIGLLVILSPWILSAAIRQGKYRQGFGQKLLGRLPKRDGARPCAWFHAVSVGEVNLLGTLIRPFQERHPDWDCVVTTTTKTGYALAQQRYPELTVCYAPLDFSWAVRRAMRRVRPDLLVLAELELWPNLVWAARREGARIAIVNGRLSENSARGYTRIRPLVAALLRQVSLIAVQNETYAERFKNLGAPTEIVHDTGSLKYDGAVTDRHNAESLRLARLAGFEPGDVVFLAGSTQDPEELIALQAFKQASQRYPELRLVIVPRHPERFSRVAAQLHESGIAFDRRSQLEQGGAVPKARVLLVDAVGELGAWWGTASIAFVGGSLGKRGGQNMIEPAAYGAAVSFGPNTRNFRDIVAALLSARAAHVVHDVEELTRFVTRCLDEPAFATTLGVRARTLVLSQLGATDRTLDLLDGLIESTVPRKSRRAA